MKPHVRLLIDRLVFWSVCHNIPRRCYTSNYWFINQVWLALEPGAVSTSSIGSSAASSPSSPTMCSPCNAAFWPGHQLLFIVGSIDIKDNTYFQCNIGTKALTSTRKGSLQHWRTTKTNSFPSLWELQFNYQQMPINGLLDAYYRIPMSWHPKIIKLEV